MTADAQSLAPTLLLSMPQMIDPNFHRTVVLLCDHNPGGAFGLVLNRPTDTSAADAVRLNPAPRATSRMPLWVGGPVEPERGWILLGEQPDGGECVRIADGVFLSMSPDLLRAILERPEPGRARLLTGYAGWGPGQLDDELGALAWLTLDVAPDLIFDTPADVMWETAIRRLGADPSALQMSRGVH
jgi:putative transcriptional regulator